MPGLAALFGMDGYPDMPWLGKRIYMRQNICISTCLASASGILEEHSGLKYNVSVTRRRLLVCIWKLETCQDIQTLLCICMLFCSVVLLTLVLALGDKDQTTELLYNCLLHFRLCN